MSEAGPSLSEIPQPPVREALYSGCEIPLVEIGMKDVAQINRINTGLDPADYDETSQDETPEDTKEWMEEITLDLDSITVDSLNAQPAIIGTKARQLVADLVAYTHISPSEDLARLPKKIRGQYAADAVVDISYVSPEKGADRKVKPIEESLLQASLLLHERVIERSVGELTGEMTPEQQNLAKQRVSILANASVSDDQENDRTALENAGFKEIHRYVYKEDGVTYIVYATSFEELSRKLKEKQTSSQTPAAS